MWLLQDLPAQGPRSVWWKRKWKKALFASPYYLHYILFSSMQLLKNKGNPKRRRQNERYSMNIDSRILIIGLVNSPHETLNYKWSNFCVRFTRRRVRLGNFCKNHDEVNSETFPFQWKEVDLEKPFLMWCEMRTSHQPWFKVLNSFQLIYTSSQGRGVGFHCILQVWLYYGILNWDKVWWR